MARAPRTILPGTALHIRQRGNNRMDCFHAADDRRRYLFLLQELAAHFDCQVHAYCLMTNHVHLLVTPLSAEACAGMMRELGRRYTCYFNRRYLRTGTLWEGRFRSCLVETARYVIACYRYIELNPVRPGMADEPATYPWSSHSANIGKRTDPLVTPHAQYLALGLEPQTRYRAYAELVREALQPSEITAIRKAISGGLKL
jgi:putative transposase